MVVLKIEHLSIKYVKQFYSLYNFCVELNDGDKLQLIGDEMSGNSFVLRAVAGIDKFYSGKIRTDIDRHDIGYAPKVPTLFENKSVLYNLCYPNLIRHLTASESENIALSVLNKYDMDYLVDRMASSLNDEEKYIVSLLRLCVRKVCLLLIDYFPNEKAQKIVKDLVKDCNMCMIATTNKTELGTSLELNMANGSIKKELK